MVQTLKTRDFMVRDVTTVAVAERVSDAIRRLGRHSFSGAPVADGDSRFQGVFSEKCCLKILSLVVMPDAPLRAADIMQSDVVSISPDDAAMEAITRLLNARISGAPVLETGKFLGVFSERTAMRVVLDSVYEQFPVGPVGAYMDPDENRIVAPETPLGTLINLFLATPYRRLVVLDGSRLAGLISRRDVIQAALPLLDEMQGVGAGNGHSAGVVPVPDRLPVSTVGTFMDRNARTITPDVGLLQVAHLFVTTNYRRLPVVEAKRLVGQVSRRDLLSAAHNRTEESAGSRHDPLYISGVNQDLPPDLRARL